MPLVAIAAMSEQRVIGCDNRLPWHLPADLMHFKMLTKGKTIIMGRLTYESIGRPLPERHNIVLTRDASFQAPGCLVVNSFESALAATSDKEEVFIIGGASLYQHLLPQIQRIYLTVIHHEFKGDTFFPELDMAKWHESSRETHQADEKNPYSYTFLTLDKI